MRTQKPSHAYFQTVLVAFSEVLMKVNLDGHGDPAVTAHSSTLLVSSEHCSGLISWDEHHQ